MNQDDRKIQRQQSLKNKNFDKSGVDENYQQNKKQKTEIKKKKEDLDQEDWEYWKEYYK
jgi:hypothetical protein